MKALRISGNTAIQFCFFALITVLFLVLSPVRGTCGTFSDDYEDGQLGSWWYVYDGSVTDADEGDGALHLAGPDPSAMLFGDILTFRQIESLTGDVSVKATFEAVNPGANTLYGIFNGDMARTDQAHISILPDFDPVLNRGTMVSFSDENVFIAPDYPNVGEVDIPEFNPGDIVTLSLLKMGDEVGGFYSVNGGGFYQVGPSTTISEPFV
ncbi:MAG: hypothetical protein HY801_09325, partial [Candidatus Lindowbacteria bacterium]|nr:hypothetical protein [Candidatus Lindowbacteria bacterium]